MKKLLLILFVFSSLSIIAQEVDYQRAYLNGKGFYREGKYSLAMEALKPAISPADGNPFAAYASFYYALSAYHQAYYPMAKDMLLQIRAQHPRWNQLDEVNFWLGKTYFEMKEFNRGLAALAEIKDTRKLGASIEAMAVTYLSTIPEMETLEQLHRERPTDKLVGTLLARKIAAQPIVDQDINLLETLVSKFKLDRSKYLFTEGLKPEKKEVYEVAVLLPFMHKTLSPEQQRRSNQFVIDLYEGIRMAADSLNKFGERIRLHVFDTERDAGVTSALLERPEMRGMDLIIGPLFPEPRKVVYEFSLKHKINMLNPLSQSSELIGLNPFSFLYSSSNETIGRKSAEFVRNNIRNKYGIIFHGPAKQDLEMAKAFYEHISELGYQIVRIEQVHQEDQRKVLDILTAKGKVRDIRREDFGIKADSIGYVFVASEDHMLASQVLSAAVIRADSMTILGPDRWLETRLLDLDALERQRIYLYSGNYFDVHHPYFKRVRDAYVKRQVQSPTKYVFQGFDLMWFTGNSLLEYGIYWQQGYREKGPIRGIFTDFYDYTKSNDNTEVTILKMQGNQLRKVNQSNK
jgi:hypothetical protein